MKLKDRFDGVVFFCSNTVVPILLAVFLVVFVAVAILALVILIPSIPFYLLWNGIMPDLASLNKVTILQSCGVVVMFWSLLGVPLILAPLVSFALLGTLFGPIRA